MIPSHKRFARKKSLPFFLPLIIAFLIVLGAVWSLRILLQAPGSDQGSGAPVATFTIPTGQARVILASGIESKIDASSPMNLLNLTVGEGIEALGSARVEVTLQDGSIIRLDGGAFITIDGYRSVDNRKTINIVLHKGNIWIKTTTEGKIDSFIVEALKSRLVMSEGIFAVSSTSLEDMYRGLKGVANIEVVQNDAVLSTFPINLGAQLRVTEQVVNDLANKKQLDLLTLIDDSFRSSDWYNYNTTKDNNGYVFIPPSNVNGVTDMNSNVHVLPSNANGTEVRGAIPVVGVLSPAEGSTVSDEVVTIKGEVTSGAEKVFVDDYQLSKYIPGQTTWIYKASTALGNLKTGRNIFQIYATSKEGVKSAIVQYSFYYQPSTNTNSTAGTTSAERLAAPTFVFPSTGAPYATTQNKVVITGTVGTGAASVVVNGYILQKYVSGSGTWSYNAYEEYETLKEGTNTYTVYAVDSAGNKSPSVTLTIVYTKTTAPTTTGTGSGI